MVIVKRDSTVNGNYVAMVMKFTHKLEDLRMGKELNRFPEGSPMCPRNTKNVLQSM